MRRILASALSIALAGAAVADDDGFLGKPALLAAQLDDIRGGYLGEDGVRLSLGIERSVLINDALVDSASLHIPDLSALRAGSPAAVQVNGALASLIQNGPANFAEHGALQAGPGMFTIIQNSLNNQLIQGRTVISIDMSGLRAVAAARALQGLDAQLHSFR